MTSVCLGSDCKTCVWRSVGRGGCWEDEESDQRKQKQMAKTMMGKISSSAPQQKNSVTRVSAHRAIAAVTLRRMGRARIDARGSIGAQQVGSRAGGSRRNAQNVGARNGGCGSPLCGGCNEKSPAERGQQQERKLDVDGKQHRSITVQQWLTESRPPDRSEAR